MPIARLAVVERDAPDHAAQPRGRRGCAKCSGKVWPLVGMQNLDCDRLLLRALPAIAFVLCIGAVLHGVGWVVFWIRIHAPSLDIRMLAVCHSYAPLYSG